MNLHLLLQDTAALSPEILLTVVGVVILMIDALTPRMRDFWIPFAASNAAWLEARSQAIVAIKKAFDAEGVGIPFPIVTLDFSDVGGRRLEEELKVLRSGSA